MAPTLTKEQMAEAAWLIATEGNISERKSGKWRYAAYSLIDTAVNQVCTKVLEEKDYLRLQSITTVPLSGGTGQLNDALMTPGVHPDYKARVMHANYVDDLKWCRSYNHLLSKKPWPNKHGYYYVEGGNSGGGVITCYNGDATPLTGSVSVIAAQYYDFANLPARLTDDVTIMTAKLLGARIEAETT